MLANRSTRIKVVESGKPPKVIPNATINFNLDYNSLKHMVKLAIRLSPEDPSYDVESITVHGKSSDYVLTPDAMDVAKTAIKALPVASSYMIAITVCHQFLFFD